MAAGLDFYCGGAQSQFTFYSLETFSVWRKKRNVKLVAADEKTMMM